MSSTTQVSDQKKKRAQALKFVPNGEQNALVLKKLDLATKDSAILKQHFEQIKTRATQKSPDIMFYPDK